MGYIANEIMKKNNESIIGENNENNSTDNNEYDGFNNEKEYLQTIHIKNIMNL